MDIDEILLVKEEMGSGSRVSEEEFEIYMMLSRASFLFGRGQLFDIRSCLPGSLAFLT